MGNILQAVLQDIIRSSCCINLYEVVAAELAQLITVPLYMYVAL